MEITFTVTDSQYETIKEYANTRKFSTPEDYIKSVALQERVNSSVLMSEALKKIDTMNSGDTFKTTDLISGNFQSVLGKLLVKESEKESSTFKKLDPDNSGSNFEKL